MSTRILALETSGFGGEVALLEGGALVYESLLTEGQRTAQSLAPGIAAALAQVGWKATEIDVVAVTIGPGSFTGLRVGVTTAKTFAYAAQCAVLGVDTLEVIAAQAPLVVDRHLWAVLDGQRSQLFARRFAVDSERWSPVSEAHVVDAEAWRAQLGSDLATGEGLHVLVRNGWSLPSAQWMLPRDLWQPRAATVGRVALRDFAAGKRDDFWKLSPVYLRPSAAEEKTQQR